MNTKVEKEVTEKSEVALREEAILSFWKEHDIFNKSIQKDAPHGDFVFYDGPPFATGLPHYGHILASTIKDAIPRFWTMNGYSVPRKWGWDCHGLPLENLIEKKLGLATKRDIEAYGVKNFNEQARDAVLEYADDWKQIIPRMGRWADMDDDYKTMDSTYTESVWWVFSQLHKKGLVYEGFKCMHLCPRCGTTLSNFEVNQGYKDIKDIAVTVKLPLLDEQGVVTDTSLLVWTTTPWTLPGNMAAAVHNDIDYVKVSPKSKVTSVEIGSGTRDGGKVTEASVSTKEFYILAKGRLIHLPEIAGIEYEIIESIKGSELVGRSYQAPFAYLKTETFDQTNAWKIWHADYVELGEEGTGAVHVAPAYGEDDMQLAKANNIPIVHHVTTSGQFKDFVSDFAGQLVKPKDDDASGIDHKDTDLEILKALRASGKILKKENITHSYPHCWRCDTPLLNYATTSWFVEVTKIKDELVEANNTVHWVPETVGKNRFGKWLEGARDWAVSRQRYWGAPLPIWRNPQSGEYKVFGTVAQLQEYVPKSGNTYFVMRHGEAHSNLSGEIDAIPDEHNPLTEDGVAQCKKSAEMLKDRGIDLIIHSGMQRTRQTAQTVAEVLGLSEEYIVVDDRVTELHTGIELEGKTWDEYETLYKNQRERFTKSIPGIENRYDVAKRVGDFLYEIDEKYKGKKILVVGHASSTYAFRCVAEGADLERSLQIKSGGYMNNAQVVEVPFVRLPHNDSYALDYHRPYIDEVELYDQDGTKLVRVPDVFDCWFESGSMPFGQQHFLGEAKVDFNPETGKGFPAQFIAEGLDQTRGWFYSLIVLGVALYGKSPFENVIVNGLVLAEDGKKMSKKLQNYPDPVELANRVGVDAMRFYLLSSPLMRAEDLHFSEKGVLELQRKNVGRLHNVLAMYLMFKDANVHASDASPHVLDRWIVARMRELIAETTLGFKNYELDKATRPVTDFIDDVSVWYLRRSRERLKNDDQMDKNNVIAALRYVLKTLSQVMAPSMPFYAEYLWQAVKEESDVESVHLSNWPQGGEVDIKLLEDMQKARTVVTFALEKRTKENINVSQIIGSVSGPDLPEPIQEVVKDEVNAEKYIVIPVSSSDGMIIQVEIDTHLTDDLKKKGNVRKFIRAIQEKRKAEGLAPQDRIVLTVQTSDGGEALVTQFSNDIKKIVGADDIVFGNAEGTEVVAGEHSFTVSLLKK